MMSTHAELIRRLATDATYYWIHRSLNHGRGSNPIKRWFRRNHTAHHRVTALDFLRGNISSLMDTAFAGFQIPLVLIATLMGMDNHAHKRHHCPRGRLINHGALFSLSGQAWGTYLQDWSLSSNPTSKHRIALPVRPRR